MPASKSINSLQEHLRDILKDGQWHSIRELYYKTEGLIRPEIAVRLYNQVKDRKVAQPLEVQIEKGKVGRIVMVLSDLGVERRGTSVSSTREYRLNPNLSSRKRENRTSLRDIYGREGLRALVSIPVVGAVVVAMNTEPLLDQRITPIQMFWFRKALEEQAIIEHELLEAEAKRAQELEDTHMATT